MKIKQELVASENVIEAFNKKKYEDVVLAIMNASRTVFPNTYKKVELQSNGECDFVDVTNGLKFDAKLPFESQQISQLANGKKHKPYIERWIKELLDEATEYKPVDVRLGTFDITSTKLYKIMKKQVLKDKVDENIIFFFPFPIVTSIRGDWTSLFATDFLKAIFNQLKKEVDFTGRSLYVIYFSGEKSIYAVRDLGKNDINFVQCTEFDKYFTSEIIGYSKD